MASFTNHLGDLASAFARVVPATLLVLAACEAAEITIRPQEADQVPERAAFAHFLSTNGPVRGLDEIAVLTREHADNFSHVVWQASYPDGDHDLNLIGIRLPDTHRLMLNMMAPDWREPSRATTDDRAAAYVVECFLENYRDRPGAWDFIRNTEKAQRWIAYGNCVWGLARSIEGANRNNPTQFCFISTTPEWNSDKKWYDLRSWVRCIDGGLL